MERYINDPESIYSIHPSRPFKYGYAYTKKECEENFQELIKDFDLKPGEVIADVGAASGYVEGALSVLLDSMTFYVQDIDTEYLNDIQFSRMRVHYDSVRGTPQTNRFYYVIGELQETKLPAASFDKIIMMNAYHEIYYKHEILTDLQSKLKPGGKLIINEFFSNPFVKRRHDGCRIRAETLYGLLNYLESAGYYLTGISEPDYSSDNVLAFSMDESLSEKFFSRKSLMDPSIDKLNELYKKKAVKDTAYISSIEAELNNSMAEIKSVYSTVEDYISDIGWDWMDKKRYSAAINVFKLNLALHSNSTFAYDDLGAAYRSAKQYAAAIKCFENAKVLDPEDDYADEAIGEINRWLAKKKINAR